jgi:hypothetical protein
MPAKPPLTLLLRGLAALALLLALLAGAHAALLHAMGAALEAGFAQWAEARRAQGWQLDHAAPVRGGWPWSASLVLRDFRLRGGAATLPGGMEWQADALVLRVTLPRLGRLAVEMPGRHRLRLGLAEFPFTAESLRAEVPIERDVLPREAVLEAERLSIFLPAGPLDVRRGRVAVETRLTATEAEPALRLRLSLEAVDLPGGGAPGLGRLVQSLSAVLVLSGPVPPGRAPAARAEAWRDGGGTLTLQGFELRWGPVVAAGTATLTLDEALQPMGAGMLRIAGADAAVAAAQEAGVVAPRPAAAARLALRLLARPDPDGGPPRVEVPLTLEARTLSVARFPLLRLGVWDWPRD